MLNFIVSSNIIVDGIKNVFYWLMMMIDITIYKIAGLAYEVFEALATVNLFGEGTYQEIVNKIYVILGVIMLFVLSYSLLKAVVNPDTFAKGEQSFPKLAQNVVVSLIIIALLPTVFNFAFSFQSSLIQYRTIPKLILNNDDIGANNRAGHDVSYYVFSSFFHVDDDWCTENGFDMKHDDNNNEVFDPNRSVCASNITGDNNESLSQVVNDYLAEGSTSGMSVFRDFTGNIGDGGLDYDILISTVAGVFWLYVVVSFCFDLAVRVFKLVFFQIIAPVPVVCRIIPGGKMKDVFSNWMKKTISTYLDVFIRVAIMFLGVFIIKELVTNFGTVLTTSFNGLNPIQILFARGLLIMGVIMFMRQAPKLLSDIFHLDSGSMKLGIRDKLAEGGAFTAYAAATGGISQAISNANKTQGSLRKKFMSAIGGGASAALRSGQGAWKSKNMNEATAAMRKARSTAEARRLDREQIYAQQDTGGGALDTFYNVQAERVRRTYENVRDSLGFAESTDSYKVMRDFFSSVMRIDDETDKIAKELMGKAAVSNSASLMNSVAGINMSMSAMREKIELMRGKGTEMIGSEVVDFDGNVIRINDENDVANYIANLNARYTKAEKDMKKYIKQQAYRPGREGISEINDIIRAGDPAGEIIKGGDEQKMVRMYTYRQNTENLMSENQNLIDRLNEHVLDPKSRISRITDESVEGIGIAYDQVDQLVTNMGTYLDEISVEEERKKRDREKRGGNSGN